MKSEIPVPSETRITVIRRGSRRATHWYTASAPRTGVLLPLHRDRCPSFSSSNSGSNSGSRSSISLKDDDDTSVLLRDGEDEKYDASESVLYVDALNAGEVSTSS